MATSQWQAVAETVEAFHKKWRSNLHHYDATKSLEDLGREREKWCLMSFALEVLFRELNECIEAHERSTEERKKRLDEELKEKEKPTHHNPYREKGE